MRSGHAVNLLTSWHVGKAEKVTLAKGSFSWVIYA
jgi:hypothetical protein